jgi:hypothetical protein
MSSWLVFRSSSAHVDESDAIELLVCPYAAMVRDGTDQYREVGMWEPFAEG